MRPSNKSRPRNKTGNTGNHGSNQRRSVGNIINRVFESAGPDGKVRGTPQQIIDKYQALARDAQVTGDRVAAESYLQHSEHYGRLLGEAQRAQQEARAQDRDGERDSERDAERGGERGGEREDGGFEPRRQAQLQPPVASGLTMIDTDDGFDVGPIETPEGRRGGFAETGGYARREREQPRVNGHTSPAAAPQAEPQSAEPQSALPQSAESPAAQPAPADSAEPVSGPTLASAAETAPAQDEPELAEPQAEPVKKPRAPRRRKTAPAAQPEEAAAVAQPEAAVESE